MLFLKLSLPGLFDPPLVGTGCIHTIGRYFLTPCC
jgi:hypothetical protein